MASTSLGLDWILHDMIAIALRISKAFGILSIPKVDSMAVHSAVHLLKVTKG